MITGGALPPDHQGDATMLPDVFPALGEWMNLYQQTGIAADKQLAIQNKSGAPVLIWEGDTPPSQGDGMHGWELTREQGPYITTESGGCWALHRQTGFTQNGRLCVQEWKQ